MQISPNKRPCNFRFSQTILNRLNALVEFYQKPEQGELLPEGVGPGWVNRTAVLEALVNAAFEMIDKAQKKVVRR